MIDKFISVKNIGIFKDLTTKTDPNWNGSFSKINSIYADNGSGKSTLCIILKSLIEKKTDLIAFKKRIEDDLDPEVIIRFSEPSKNVRFSSSSWKDTVNLPKIIIYDNHFIEDYVFRGSISTNATKTNFIQLVLGGDGTNLFNSIKATQRKITSVDSIRLKLNRADNEYKKLTKEFKELNESLLNFREQYINLSDSTFKNFIEKANFYLKRLTQNVLIRNITIPIDKRKLDYFPELNFEFKGSELRFENPNSYLKTGQIKYTLSEGDKNAIALSFFIATLELSKCEDQIVIFDDPLSSFDSNRKMLTLHFLSNIAEKSKQFFLFSHDSILIEKFYKKNPNSICLTIQNFEEKSYIKSFDIRSESKSNLHKDLKVINNFKVNGAQNESEKRDVIRCIRPILEGIIKIKFFKDIPNDIWLGEIISIIRNSRLESEIGKLKPIENDLAFLNDYSKEFHHNSNSHKEVINVNELNNNIDLLLKLFSEI